MNLYKLISDEEAAKIVKAVEGMEWKTGKARTKELTGTTKQNQEILASDKNAKHLLKLLGEKVMANNSIGLNHIPLKLHPFKFSKYENGGQYHPHTDAPWMGETRTDVSCTLWLSEPESYDGGDLIINGKSWKGNPGEILFYNCGDVHYVTPVTRGKRICAVTWVQSRIRDPIKRKMITDFRRWLSKMEGTDLFNEGSPIYSALLKRWME